MNGEFESAGVRGISMKSFGIFCVFALALSLQVARANDNATIQPYSLGVVEGGIKYCAKVDSANEPEYLAYKVILLKGLSKTALENARNNCQVREGLFARQRCLRQNGEECGPGRLRRLQGPAMIRVKQCRID